MHPLRGDGTSIGKRRRGGELSGENGAIMSGSF